VPTEIERLYREHRAGLVRLVERELRDHHEAEDVVQTAFLDAQRALERGTIPRNPRAWLAAIALNAARRLRRRRLNAAPLEEYAVEEASGVTEIRAALTSLPKEQQTAVVYRDVLGFSYGETAQQMGRSVNAVTMLLHRGRRRLRQTLGVTAGGVGLWRWLRQAGTPQAAIAKGAAVVAVSAGLATGGVVAAGRAARVAAPVAPIGTAAPDVQPGHAHAASVAGGAGRPHGVEQTRDSPQRRLKTASAAVASPSPNAASTQRAAGVATRAGVRSSTAAAPAPPPDPQPNPVLRLPTVSLPTLPAPTVPVTVAATVAVSTPVTTATVSASAGATVTVATPITTVTLPIP
jgi:RNA polymerase sigma factor (sigma-70 family)